MTTMLQARMIALGFIAFITGVRWPFRRLVCAAVTSQPKHHHEGSRQCLRTCSTEDLFNLTGHVAVFTDGNSSIGPGHAPRPAKAGGGFLRPFLDWTIDDWNHVLSLDVRSVFAIFQEAACHMIERGGGGKLVVTGSVGTIVAMPGHLHPWTGRPRLPSDRHGSPDGRL